MTRNGILTYYQLSPTAILITQCGPRRFKAPAGGNLHLAPFNGFTLPKGRCLCISRTKAASLLVAYRAGVRMTATSLAA